jgi:hypothetical protein
MEEFEIRNDRVVYQIPGPAVYYVDQANFNQLARMKDDYINTGYNAWAEKNSVPWIFQGTRWTLIATAVSCLGMFFSVKAETVAVAVIGGMIFLAGMLSLLLEDKFKEEYQEGYKDFLRSKELDFAQALYVLIGKGALFPGDVVLCTEKSDFFDAAGEPLSSDEYLLLIAANQESTASFAS